jgi:hypothetical protein
MERTLCRRQIDRRGNGIRHLMHQRLLTWTARYHHSQLMLQGKDTSRLSKVLGRPKLGSSAGGTRKHDHVWAATQYGELRLYGLRILRAHMQYRPILC